jgi:glutathione S-transferase
MRIIDEPRAPNPRRVRIFLAEKGIPMTFEPVSINRLEHRTEAFTRLNPFQQVPVLVLDDGSTICESVAICRYFEELQPEPALLGRDARAKAEIEMWQRRVELGLLQPIFHVFRHLHPAMAQLEVPQIAAWGEANRGRVLSMLRLLDEQLAGRPFIAGAELSIADITLLVAVDFMKPARIERPTGLAALAGWYERMAARPSAAA